MRRIRFSWFLVLGLVWSGGVGSGCGHEFGGAGERLHSMSERAAARTAVDAKATAAVDAKAATAVDAKATTAVDAKATAAVDAKAATAVDAKATVGRAGVGVVDEVAVDAKEQLRERGEREGELAGAGGGWVAIESWDVFEVIAL